MKLKFLGVATVVCAGLMSVFGATSVYAEVTCPAGSIRGGEDGKGTANTYAECNFPEEVAKEDDLMTTVVRILNVVVGVAGVVAVAVIIIGGIFYVISQGDAAKLMRAKNTILYGVVGLVISLLAFAIVNFVLSSVFKSRTDEGDDTTVTPSGGLA